MLRLFIIERFYLSLSLLSTAYCKYFLLALIGSVAEYFRVLGGAGFGFRVSGGNTYDILALETRNLTPET